MHHYVAYQSKSPIIFMLLLYFLLNCISPKFVTGSPFATTGSQSICFITDPLRYVNVSNQPFHGSASVGSSRLLPTTWTGQTSLCLKSNSGSGSILTVSFSLNRLVESFDTGDFNLDYASGSVRTGSSNQFPTSGGMLVYLTGSGFGMFDLSPTSKFGFGIIQSRQQPMLLFSYLDSTVSSSTVWKSDSSIAFSTANGNGRGFWSSIGQSTAQMLVLKLGLTISSTTSLFTFASPIVESSIHQKISTGSQNYVIGNSFSVWNDLPKVRYASSTSALISHWLSDSSVEAKFVVPPFKGSTLIVVSVSSQKGSHQASWNVSMTARLLFVLIPSTGSKLSWIFGQGFGLHRNSLRSKTIQSASQLTLWKSDSDISIKSSATLGKESLFSLTINQFSNKYDSNIDVSNHVIQIIVRKPEYPSSGAILLPFMLLNGGVYDQTYRCRLGASSQSSSSWRSDSSIVVKSNSGLVRNFGVSASSNGVVSSTTDFMDINSTNSTHSFFPLCVPLTGSHLNFIFSRSLDMKDLSLRTRLSNSDCQMSSWSSDSGVICKSPGVSTTAVKNGFSTCLSIPLFEVKSAGGSYAFITFIRVNLVADGVLMSSSTGSERVVLTSNSFGMSDMSIQLRSGNSESLVSMWFSQTSVVAKFSPGSGANHFVHTSTPHRLCIQTNRSTLMSYFTPRFNTTLVFDCKSVATGSSIMPMLAGMYFGTEVRSISTRLKASSSSNLELTNWMADSSLSCKLSASILSNMSILTTVENLASNPSPMMPINKYMNETLVFADISTPAQTGGHVVRLYSKSFGTLASTSKNRFVLSSSEMSNWLSDSSTISKHTSSSSYKQPDVVVSIIHLMSVWGAIYEDSAATISALSSVSPKPSSASFFMTLSGAFSSSDQSFKLKLTPSNCLASSWTSVSSLRCKVPPSVVSSWQIAVSVIKSTANFSVANIIWTNIYSISLMKLITTGSATIQFLGPSGIFDSSPRSKFGQSSCIFSKWISDSQLHIKYVYGHGDISSFYFSIDSVRSSSLFSSGYTYSLPNVTLFNDLVGFNSSIRQNDSSIISSGSVLIQLGLSVGLGTSSHSSRCRLQASAIEASIWISDSIVSVKISTQKGVNKNRKLTFTIAKLVSESFASFFSHRFLPFSHELALLPSTGSVLLELIAFNMIIREGSLSVNFGASVCAQSNWKSSSSLTAKSVPATGFSKSITISSHSFIDTVTIFLSYHRPQILVNSQSALSSSGALISVTGRFSGSFGHTCAIRLAISSSPGTRWISSSAITATCVAGPGLILNVLISYSEFKINSSSNISFEVPMLASITDAMFSGSGATLIFASGSYFAMYDASARGQISVSSVESTKWISSSIICTKVFVALHTNVRMVLSLANFRGSSAAVNCSKSTRCGPSISSATLSTLITSGSFLVGISGQNFITNDQSPAIRFMYSSASVSFWTSDSLVTAKVANFLSAGSLRVEVTCGRFVSLSIATNKSMDVTNISSISSYFAPTTGNVLITIFGHGFGTSWASSSISVGLLSTQVTWISDSAVACKPREFVSSSVKPKWNDIEISSPIFSFSAMIVSALSRYNSAVVQSSARILAFGTYFGMQDPTMTVFINSQKLSTVWVSESCVVTAPTFGTGQNLTFSIMSNSAVGAPIPFTFSYDTLAFVDGTDDHAPVIGRTLNIFGNNFGTGSLPVPSASIGLTACTQVFRPILDLITCRVQPGTGRGLSVCVYRSAESFCRSDFFSYLAPTISGFQTLVPMFPATGKTLIFAYGSNFGAISYSPISRLASKNQVSTHSVRSVWTSTTSLHSLMSRALGNDVSVFASVSQQSSNRIQLIVSKPLFLESQPFLPPSTSSFRIFFVAQNLGLCQQSIRSNVLKSSSEATFWTSDSLLMIKSGFIVLFSELASLVSVQRNTNIRINTINTEFFKPILRLTDQSNYEKSSSGSMIVTTFGSRFRSVDSSLSSRFVGSAIEALSWVSDSSVVSKISSWIHVGVSHVLCISVNQKTSSISVLKVISDYDVVELIQSADVTSLVTNTSITFESTGSTVVTVLGTSFGPSDSSLAIRFTSTSFASSLWKSQSSIVCKSVPFSSKERRTFVLSLNSAFIHQFTLTHHSFRSPVVSSYPVFFPSTGSLSTPKHLSAMGFVDLTQRIRLHKSALASSLWVSDSLIVSKISSGIADTKVLHISTDSTIFGVIWNSSYDISFVSSLIALNLSSSGNFYITCHGSSFGTDLSTVRMRYFHTSDQSTFWTSDSCVHFKRSSFAQKSYALVIVSLLGRRREFDLNRSISVDIFSANLLKASIPSSGSAFISSVGSSMLQVSMSSKISFGSSACILTLWKSSSSMLCKVTSSLYSPLHFLISINQIHVILPNTSVIILDVSFVNFSHHSPATGSIIQLFFSGLGNYDISSKISLSSACESTLWIADSSMLCKSPLGQLQGVGLIVTLANRISRSDRTFFRNGPIISGVHPSTTPSTGLSVLTLSGSGFIFHNLSNSLIHIGSTRVPHSIYVSDSSLLATAPAGEGTVNVYMQENLMVTRLLAYSFGTINFVNSTLSDHRTGHLFQMEIEFYSSQTIESLGMIIVKIPNQIQIQNESTFILSNLHLETFGEWSLKSEYVRFYFQRSISPCNFSLFLRNMKLSSTVAELDPLLVRSSMISNITIDSGLLFFNISIIPSNALQFSVFHSTLYAGSTTNFSIYLKPFNVVEIGDIFVIKFPESGASFASALMHSSLDVVLQHRSSSSFVIEVLTSVVANISFHISGIVVQPFSGQIAPFSGNHCNHLGILKENWIATDSFSVHPGQMRNVNIKLSNNTIGTIINIEVSFIPANDMLINSILLLEFPRNEINLTDQVYMGSLKLLSFLDGNSKLSIQIPTPILLGATVRIVLRNAFINFGSSRSATMMFTSQAFNSAWNSSVLYEPIIIDTGVSNPILLTAPMVYITSKYSSLQMRAQVQLNMTMQIPNTLPPSGYLEITIFNFFNFSASNITIASNCFDADSTSTVRQGSKVITSIRCLLLQSLQSCFILVDSVESPGFPGYNGRVSMVIFSESGLHAIGESTMEFFFVSFISAKISGNCSVTLSWNNTILVGLPESWAISCSACSEAFRQKTYAPHLRYYHYDNMPCLTGSVFSFLLREIDPNGSAVIPKAFHNLDAFEPDQWRVKLPLMTLPSAPTVSNLNQTSIRRVTFNWMPIQECYGGHAAYCPVSSSIITITSPCHASPDTHSTTSFFYDVTFEFSTNYTVCISLINDAGASEFSCFSHVIDQPHRSNASMNFSISFVNIPTNIAAGVFFSPEVTVRLETAVPHMSENLTIFSTFILNDTMSMAASFRTCAVTTENGLAVFSNMSFSGIGTAVMDVYLANSVLARSPQFQTTIGVAAKVTLVDVNKIATAAIAFPKKMAVEVTDSVDNVHSELDFVAKLTFTSISNANQTYGPFTASSDRGLALFDNVIIDRVGDYFGQVQIFNFQSSLFFVEVLSGASILIHAEVQPSDSKGGEIFKPLQPLLTLRDRGNNIAIDYFDYVTTSFEFASDSNAQILGVSEKFSYLGVCRFYDMAINFAGLYRLKYSAVGLISAFSTTIAIVAGDPFKLSMVKQPSEMVAGSSVLGYTSVKVVDRGGNFINSSNFTITAKLSFKTFSNVTESLSTECISGIATFSNFPIQSSGTAYFLTFTASTLLPENSDVFAVVPGPAAFLAFTLFPEYGLGGLIFQPAIRLFGTDLWGNTLHSGYANGQSRTVNISIQNCSYTSCLDKLFGDRSSNFFDGVAVFENIGISLVGWYVFTFSIDNMTKHRNITVYSSNATFLTVERKPSICYGGEICKAQPIISVRDVATNIAESHPSVSSLDVFASLSSDSSWKYLGTAATISRGVAAFTNFGFDKVGTYFVTFSSHGIIPCSIFVNVTAGVQSSFQLTLFPRVNASGGSIFNTQPSLTFYDLGYNVANCSDAVVLVALLFSNGTEISPSFENLFGDIKIVSEGPIATFKNIGIRTAALGYKLRFSSALVPDVFHFPIDVYPGTARSIQIQSHPTDALGGQVFSTQPVILLLDLGLNVAVNNHDFVIVSLLFTTNSQSRIIGTRNISASFGVCRFFDLALDMAGSHIFAYAAQGINAAVSPNITISVGPSANIRLGIEPSNITGGSQFHPFLYVEVIDLGGNVVFNNNFSIICVTLLTENENASLLGNLTSISAAGIAMFGNITVDKVGNNYSLYFKSEFSSTMSVTFSVTIGELKALKTLTAPSHVIAGQCMLPFPTFGLFDGGWNMIYSEQLTAVARLSPDSYHHLEFQNTSIDGMFVFECVNSTRAGESWIILIIHPGNFVFESANFTTVHGIGHHFVTSAFPQSAVCGVPFSIQPILQICDAFGNHVYFNAVPAMSVQAFSRDSINGRSILLGPSIQNVAIDGSVNFHALYINLFTSTDWQIVFTSNVSGIFDMTSPGIRMTYGDSFEIELPHHIISAQFDQKIQPYCVNVKDTGGNIKANHTGTILANISKIFTPNMTSTEIVNFLNGTNEVSTIYGRACFSFAFPVAAIFSLIFSSQSEPNLTIESSLFISSECEVKNISLITPSIQNISGGNLLLPHPTIEINGEQCTRAGASAFNVHAVLMYANGSSPKASDFEGESSVQPMNGLAKFNNFTINRSDGPYVVKFVFGLFTVHSNSFFVLIGPPQIMLIVQQPSSLNIAGEIIHVQPIVGFFDRGMNLNETLQFNVTVTLCCFNSNATFLSGSSTVSSKAGLAEFQNLSVRLVASGWILVFSCPGFDTITSRTFQIKAGNPFELIIQSDSQPLNATACLFFPVQPTVAIVDKVGNVVPSGTDEYSQEYLFTSLKFQGNETSLYDWTAVPSKLGTFELTNLTYCQRGFNFVLEFFLNNSSVQRLRSQPFSIPIGVAINLRVLQEPNNFIAGDIMQPPIIVASQFYDGSFAPDANVMQVKFFSKSSNISIREFNVAMTRGFCTLPSFSWNFTGDFRIEFNLNGLRAASNFFHIFPGSPQQLTIRVQPSDTSAAKMLSPPPEVLVLDYHGNYVSVDGIIIIASLSVQESISNLEPNPMLSGKTLCSSQMGLCTFFNISINKAHSGYQIMFSSLNFTFAINSIKFKILFGLPIRMVMHSQPPNSVFAGELFPLPMQVAFLDLGDNIAEAGSFQITASSNFSSAWKLSNFSVLGVASFFGIKFNALGSFHIDFSSSGFLSISSSKTTILPGAPFRISFGPVANGSSVSRLFSLEQVPIVTFRDKGDNIINISQEITLFLNSSLEGSFLRGNLTVMSYLGIATFQNIYLDKCGKNYQLFAWCNFSGSMFSAQSSQFDLNSGPPAIIKTIGSVGLMVDGLSSTFFFTNRLFPSVCLQITDSAGNALQNVSAEIYSEGDSNPMLAGVTKVATNEDGIACFDSLILKGKFVSSVTFLFLVKSNHSTLSMSISNISVLPQLDIEAILDGSSIIFTATQKVPSFYREATSAAFGANLPTIFDERTLKHFGLGATCLWTSEYTFVVYFGASPSFASNFAFYFIPSFLNGLFFFDHSKLRYIQKPMMLPSINIVFSGSTTVLGCSAIYIDIFGSTGSYGRSFSTKWKLKSISQRRFTSNHSQASIFDAVALQLLNWDDSYFFTLLKLRIANETVELPPANYTFEIQTIRWIDSKLHLSEISVTKRDDLLPTVSIAGPKLLSIYAHESFELLGMASPACGFSASFSFYWRISDLLNPQVVVLEFTGSSLTVPENILFQNSSYNVTLTVSSGDVQNFDNIIVRLKRSAPFLIIRGGNRTFIMDSDLVLDSSPSIDIDGANFSEFSFEWKCESLNHSVCDVYINSPEARIAYVLKSSLVLGTEYIFSLKASIINTSVVSYCKVSLFVSPAGSPKVSIISLSRRKINPGIALRIEGTAQPMQELKWSEIGTEFKLLSPLYTYPSTDPRAIVFRPNVLPHGTTLKMRLSTTVISSYAEIEFEVNQPPFGGQMVISSNPFIEDIYVAEIAMIGWTDDTSDLPISFEYSLNTADSLDLASASSTSSKRKIFLSFLKRTAIVAKVSDSFGTSRYISQFLASTMSNSAKVKSQNLLEENGPSQFHQISSKLMEVKVAGDNFALISLCSAILGSIFNSLLNSSEVEALRFEIILHISDSIPIFPPLRSSQSAVIATVLAKSLVNLSASSSLIAVRNGAHKLLITSSKYMQPDSIQNLMIIAKSTSLHFRQNTNRLLLQQVVKMSPDIESFISFLNHIEHILSRSLVQGQDVSSFVVSGLSFVANVAPSEMLCRNVSILDVQTATAVSVSHKRCLEMNVVISDHVVLLIWNMQSNPFSAISSVLVTSGVLRLNARVNSGLQINDSSITFALKIYKQPAAWTSMTSLAICVKWEFELVETDGHWSAENCQKTSEDFDHLMCSCTGLSFVAITIIPKDCVGEPYGIPGFKATPSVCTPEQIIPITIIAGVLSILIVLGFLSFVLLRRYRTRKELMRLHMQIANANIEETRNSLWTSEIGTNIMPCNTNT